MKIGKERLRRTEDRVSSSNHPSRITGGENGREAVFEDMMAENFPELIKDTNPQTETQ